MDTKELPVCCTCPNPERHRELAELSGRARINPALCYKGDNRRDPTQYQVEVAGKPKRVSELTLEEAQQELCRVYDHVERLVEFAALSNETLQRFLTGEN